MKRMMILLAFAWAHAAAAAPVLVNGSLEGPIANSATPPGWTITSHSPDTMNEFNNIGVSGLLDFGATPSPSPDGGTWVGMFMVGTTIEMFEQDVSGFDIGQAYEISWWHSNFGYAFSLADVAVEVWVDGVSIGAGPTLSLGTGWYLETLSFVATSTMHTIEFGSSGTIGAYHGVDGIRITEVPEPTTAMLLGLGLAGLAVRRRRTR